MEDVDSSALAQILEIISSRCALYMSVILGKPEVHPIFGGKKLFINITHQILNFILESELIKISPYCIVIIYSFFLYILQQPLLLFVLFNAMKIYSNLTLRHMWEFLLAWDKL